MKQIQGGKVGREGGTRSIEGVAGRSVFDDRTVREDVDTVGEHECVEDVVGDEDGCAVAEHARQHSTERGRDRNVESGHRFVQEQKLGLRGESAGDGDALGLSSGEFARSAVRELQAVDFRQPVSSEILRGGTVHPLATSTESDVLEHGQVREEVGVLGKHRDTAAVGRSPHVRAAGIEIEQDASVEFCATPLGAEQPGDDVQRRRFACTVGSEDRDGLPGFHAEGHPESPLGHGR